MKNKTEEKWEEEEEEEEEVEEVYLKEDKVDVEEVSEK